MQIAIVAATEMELTALRKLSFPSECNISFYVHGVGMLAAMYHIQKIAFMQPDMILQVGIAGTYNKLISIGDAVAVRNEYVDQGAEEKNELLDLFDLNLLHPQDIPFQNGALPNHHIPAFMHIPTVNSLTVNVSSGTQQTITLRNNKYHADIETMEGACLHYVCLMENISFIQLRGISNKVEVRNKANWNIQAALQSVHQAAHQFIHQLNTTV